MNLHPRLCFAALAAIPDAVLISDVDGRIAYANPAAEAYTGYPAAELLDNFGGPLVLGDNPQELLEEMHRRVLGGETWHGELRFRRRDGSVYLGRTAISPITSEEGAVTHLLSIHRDITAFRRAAEDQRRQQANMLALIERIPEALAVVRGFALVYVNPRMVELLGYRRGDELLGCSVLDLVHPSERALTEARIHEMESTGTALPPRRARMVGLQGKVVCVEVAAIPVVYDGQPALVFTARDLAEREAAEVRVRETDRMVAIGTLAAGIAHEINTPIQFIGDSAHFLGAAFADLFRLLDAYRRETAALTAPPEIADALAKAEEDADAAYLEEHVPKAIERTVEGVGRVATIVRAMKEFGHPGADQFAPADLGHALDNTIVVARNEYKYVADVETDFGDLPPVVCNLGSMNQVFLNLLVNAAHAIAGRVRQSGERGLIRVTTRQEGANAHVTITDNGTGIPMEVRDRVFDPFFTTKEVGKGTGQGLAIARSVVVDRHRGRIWFDTETGVGTTFHVLVPLEQPDSP